MTEKTNTAADIKQLKSVIEAALMASEVPLSVRKIRNMFEESERPETTLVNKALKAIEKDCASRGVELRQIGKGYRFQTKDQYAGWLRKLRDTRPPRYSRALVETLSIIAYRQPVTRGDIEGIRGVAVSSDIMRTLLDREWISQVGHRDVPGRPALYATTDSFLEYFNLRSLSELPALMEPRDVTDVAKDLNITLPIAKPDLSAGVDVMESDSDDDDEDDGESEDSPVDIEAGGLNVVSEPSPSPMVDEEDDEDYDDDEDEDEDEDDDESESLPADIESGGLNVVSEASPSPMVDEEDDEDFDDEENDDENQESPVGIESGDLKIVSPQSHSPIAGADDDEDSVEEDESNYGSGTVVAIDGVSAGADSDKSSSNDNGELTEPDERQPESESNVVSLSELNARQRSSETESDSGNDLQQADTVDEGMPATVVTDDGDTNIVSTAPLDVDFSEFDSLPPEAKENESTVADAVVSPVADQTEDAIQTIRTPQSDFEAETDTAGIDDVDSAARKDHEDES